MKEFFAELTSSSMFGLALTCLVYGLCGQLRKKWSSPLLNPLIFSIVVICAVLSLSGIPLENYQKGGDMINAMLTPVTCVLACMVYRRLETLKRFWLPVLCGCTAGALTAIGSTALLCHLFNLNQEMTRTLLPKSVTGPFALTISEMIGGLPSVTMACVAITGMMGLVCSPFLLKHLHMKHPVASGVALGTSCHALGTVRAMELGDEQGAMSSLAMCISGIVMFLVGMGIA